MSQQQLMQLFGGSLGGGNMSGLASLLGGAGAGRSRQAAGTGRTRPAPPADGGSSSPATPATPSTVPVPAPAPGGAGQSANPIQLSDLQSILSNIQVPPGEGGAEGSSGPAVDLSTAQCQCLLQHQVELVSLLTPSSCQTFSLSCPTFRCPLVKEVQKVVLVLQ